MVIFSILAIGIIIAFVIYISKKKCDSVNSNTECNKSSNPIEIWGITEPVTDHEEVHDTWTTNVAGVSKRCSTKDVGGIVGYVDAEPTNTYNPHAMAVYLHTGRHIGYIYDSELEDYRSWSRCKRLPFVGYIQPSENGVSSRIHIIVPKSREFLVERAGKFYIPIKEDGKNFLIPNVKDMVVPDRVEAPKQPDVETDINTRNNCWGFCHGYNVRDPKSIPPSTVKYHMSNILSGDGYALYRFLEANIGKTINIESFATYRNPDRDYISSDEEAKDLMCKQLDELIFCSIATVNWFDLTHFTFELLQTIPTNDEWERKRKWKQWLKQATQEATASTTSEYKVLEDSDVDSQDQPILEDDESYTFPALRKKEFLFVVVNEKLIDREHELIGKIYNLIQEICQQDDFVKEVKAIIPATYEVDPAFVFLIGDITTCIHEIGGDADAYSPHGIALIMAVNKITNHDELSDNISLMAISDENMQLYRDISSGFNSACHSISGYKTFIISSILNNIDSPKYREYIDLMTKLTELLVEIKDKHPNKSQDFIKHLNAIKEDVLA